MTALFRGYSTNDCSLLDLLCRLASFLVEYFRFFHFKCSNYNFHCPLIFGSDQHNYKRLRYYYFEFKLCKVQQGAQTCKRCKLCQVKLLETLKLHTLKLHNFSYNSKLYGLILDVNIFQSMLS